MRPFSFVLVLPLMTACGVEQVSLSSAITIPVSPRISKARQVGVLILPERTQSSFMAPSGRRRSTASHGSSTSQPHFRWPLASSCPFPASSPSPTRPKRALLFLGLSALALHDDADDARRAQKHIEQLPERGPDDQHRPALLRPQHVHDASARMLRLPRGELPSCLGPHLLGSALMSRRGKRRRWRRTFIPRSSGIRGGTSLSRPPSWESQCSVSDCCLAALM